MENKREIRGRILKILHINYPNTTSTKLIEITLQDLDYDTSPGILGAHYSYLEEKGYIEKSEIESHHVSRTMLKLTAKGIDLIEGSIKIDPGVMLDVE